MLARLMKQAARLGRKVTGWTNRGKAAEGWVNDLTEQIDRLEERREDVIARADQARRNGQYEKSRRLDKKALAIAGKLGAKKERRRFWIGRRKTLLIEKRGFKKYLAEIEQRIKELEGKVKFDVENNKVTGGTDKEKWIGASLLAAKRCSKGLRANYYSQPGAWTAIRLFIGEILGVHRSDCSQFTTSTAYTCGFDDPNGGDFVGGGFTGTLLQAHGKWQETDRATFLARGWGYCVYGSGTGFHVENYIGSTKTIGHGDSQINEGYLDMFSPRRYFIYG